MTTQTYYQITLDDIQVVVISLSGDVYLVTDSAYEPTAWLSALWSSSLNFLIEPVASDQTVPSTSCSSVLLTEWLDTIGRVLTDF